MAAVLGGLAPTYGLFLVTRLIAGVGMGGLFGLAYSMFTESWKTSKRGAMGGFDPSFRSRGKAGRAREVDPRAAQRRRDVDGAEQRSSLRALLQIGGQWIDHLGRFEYRPARAEIEAEGLRPESPARRAREPHMVRSSA